MCHWPPPACPSLILCLLPTCYYFTFQVLNPPWSFLRQSLSMCYPSTPATLLLPHPTPDIIPTHTAVCSLFISLKNSSLTIVPYLSLGNRAQSMLRSKHSEFLLCSTVLNNCFISNSVFVLPSILKRTRIVFVLFTATIPFLSTIFS